jgi:hypothetical protein
MTMQSRTDTPTEGFSHMPQCTVIRLRYEVSGFPDLGEQSSAGLHTFQPIVITVEVATHKLALHSATIAGLLIAQTRDGRLVTTHPCSNSYAPNGMVATFADLPEWATQIVGDAVARAGSAWA